MSELYKLLGMVLFWLTLPLALLASTKVWWIVLGSLTVIFAWKHNLFAAEFMAGIMLVSLVSKFVWDTMRFG